RHAAADFRARPARCPDYRRTEPHPREHENRRPEQRVLQTAAHRAARPGSVDRKTPRRARRPDPAARWAAEGVRGLSCESDGGVEGEEETERRRDEVRGTEQPRTQVRGGMRE